MLPFEGKAWATEWAWLPKAISGSLVAQFNLAPSLNPVPRTYVYRLISQITEADLERKAVIVASRFKCEFVVYGTFTFDGEHLTITAHLLRQPREVTTETVTGQPKRFARAH